MLVWSATGASDMKNLRQVHAKGYRYLLSSEVRQLRDEIVSTQRDVFTRARAQRAAELSKRQEDVREMIEVEYRQARLEQAAADLAARTHEVETRYREVQRELDTNRRTRIAEAEHDHDQRMQQNRERRHDLQNQAHTLHTEIAAEESRRLAAANDLHHDRMAQYVARMEYVHNHGVETHQLLHRHQRETAEMCDATRLARQGELNAVYGWVEEFTGRPLRD